jgi:hypothetical protein
VPDPAACADELDNDGDGKIDFPVEPGCADQVDDDELDPDPLPECADGEDNDSDGETDYPEDIACWSAADDRELGAGEHCFWLDGDITSTGVVVATIADGANDLESSSCGGFGNERAYTYAVTGSPPLPALVITTDHPETTVDTVLYVWENCLVPSSEVACDDDGGERPYTSTIVLEDTIPTQYVIVVDSFGPGSLGEFKLTVSER